MKTPILKTPRLILRPITIEDAPAVQKYFNDWKIIQYICDAPWPYPDDGALTHIRDTILPGIKQKKMYVWAITLKDSNDEAIGLVSYRLKADNPYSDRGFWLAVPYHGDGLMSEAITCVNDFVFNTLGIKNFKVRNIKGNIGSHRIKEKTGGILVAEMEEVMLNGKTEIMELWEVTKDSWEEAKANRP